MVSSKEIKQLNSAARRRDIEYIKAHQDTIYKLIDEGYFAGQGNGAPKTDKYRLAHRLAWLAAEHALDFEQAIKKQLITIDDDICKAVLSGDVSKVKYALSKVAKSSRELDLNEAIAIAVFTKQPADIIFILLHNKNTTKDYIKTDSENILPTENVFLLAEDAEKEFTILNQRFMDIDILRADIIRSTRIASLYVVLRSLLWGLVVSGLMALMASSLLLPYKIMKFLGLALPILGSIVFTDLNSVIAQSQVRSFSIGEKIFFFIQQVLAVTAIIGMGIAAIFIPGLIPAFIITAAVISFVTTVDSFLIPHARLPSGHNKAKFAEKNCASSLLKYLQAAKKQHLDPSNTSSITLDAQAKSKFDELEQLSPGLVKDLHEHFKQRITVMEEYAATLELNKDPDFENYSKIRQFKFEQLTQLETDFRDIEKSAVKGTESFCLEVTSYLSNFEANQQAQAAANLGPYAEDKKSTLRFAAIDKKIAEHINEIAAKTNLKL